MENRLLLELRTLYSVTREKPRTIRIQIRMRDLIDPDAFCRAVDTTMRRYPYFCVELRKQGEDYVYAGNDRPVVIVNDLEGVPLNSAESNYHMAAFAWKENWIVFDIFHGLTDGTGAYEVIRTLLYYYCSERYGVRLKEEGIRLLGDVIPQEEWDNPVLSAKLPTPTPTKLAQALSIVREAGLQQNDSGTVYSVSVSESEFMRFNIANDGSPGTMAALFLSRGIARLFPDASDPIRIALCVNLRKALHAPLAHQSLVIGAMLEYKPKLRAWPLGKQATAYRGMVFAQTMEETALAGLSSQMGIVQMLLSKKTEAERIAVAGYVDQMAEQFTTAVVSYVGKANYKESEQYIRDFRLWTTPPAKAPLIEISAVNGQFTFDFIQPFSNPVIVNAFLRELEKNGIVYDLKDVRKLALPLVQTPWTE